MAKKRNIFDFNERDGDDNDLNALSGGVTPFAASITPSAVNASFTSSGGVLSGFGDGLDNDVAFLGEGNDTFVWNPGDGSDVVEGQAGFDTLDFNGANISEVIDISANGQRVLFPRDVANITMDLNDVEHITFDALGGCIRSGRGPERDGRETGRHQPGRFQRSRGWPG